MAKAKSSTKKIVPKDDGSPIPNFADLKYIGAAIDRAIESLQEIKVHAQEPRKVDDKIASLNKIKSDVRLECPQQWFLPFKLKA